MIGNLTLKYNSMFRRKLFICPLFWGLIWGAAEATLGHLLHLISIPGLAGFIMFPVGMVFMIRAWLVTGHPASIFLASSAAAAVKLFNMFLPGPGIYAALNPALAILCEGLAVAGLFSFVRAGYRFHIFSLLSVSLSWRLIYFGLIAAPAALMAVPNFLMLGSYVLFKFIFLESMINTIILSVILKPVQPRLNSNILLLKSFAN
jgi:hypothetical protein